MANTKWADMPTWARAGIVAAGALEAGLLTAAQIDITRRPADRIRGGAESGAESGHDGGEIPPAGTAVTAARLR